MKERRLIIIELGKKLVKEHPEVGSEGNMAIYLPGLFQMAGRHSCWSIRQM